MPFDASKAEQEIVKLDFDFRPFVNASGRTEEPTEELIVEFQEATKNDAVLLGRGEEVDLDDSKSILKFMRSLTKEDRLKIRDNQLKALAKLTQGRPSYEQLRQFYEKHYRLCIMYMGSIMGDILNPKGESIDTSQ